MRRDCWHDGKLMNIRERFVVEYKLLIRLAPRPGLEPGTCGLTVRRSRHRINTNNQVFMPFSVGSVFWHLMGVSALQQAVVPN